MPETLTFAAAAVKFFGYNGKTLSDFSKELKALTAEDRANLAPLLGEALGVPVTP